MEAGLAYRIETGVARGASALFAGAIGYAAYGFSAGSGVDPRLALGAAGMGSLAYVPCSRLLRSNRRDDFLLADFVPAELEFSQDNDELLLTERASPTGELLLTDVVSADELLLTERVSPDELLLTEADRADAPLVLDDILAALGPDSRVVRLFDRKAMPTAGQLQSRIADHMKDGARPSAPSVPSNRSDAAQALSAALAELRRSLR